MRMVKLATMMQKILDEHVDLFGVFNHLINYTMGKMEYSHTHMLELQAKVLGTESNLETVI